MGPSATALPPSAAASRRSGADSASAWRRRTSRSQLRRAVGLPEREGLLVREVEDDSPAAKAGIAEGDLLVAIGGKDVSGADDLFEALAGEGPLELTPRPRARRSGP